MTATTLEQPTPVASPNTTVRVLMGVLFAALLVVTFVAGRVSAPEDTPAVPARVVTPAAAPTAHADADIPCGLYQPC